MKGRALQTPRTPASMRVPETQEGSKRSWGFRALKRVSGLHGGPGSAWGLRQRDGAGGLRFFQVPRLAPSGNKPHEARPLFGNKPHAVPACQMPNDAEMGGCVAPRARLAHAG